MKLKNYLMDILKAVAIGLIASGIIIVLIGIVALIVNSGSILPSLTAVRGALCIIGALGLIISAAMLISKKNGISKDYEKEWRAHFNHFNLLGVILTVSSALLLIAGGIDSLLYIF
ncbi:hypothetical protein R2R35_03960 [Anaerocolumna sp. AGMB13020]|uniref:hypothetical protein n=1 Tax=Anaerocolumna sp. AGMB13020 TaxID=3081750 RepID=UPI00295408CD|nr:hypothetical protein [Anaerocolumna sp. AGMB13020]WOO37660.1 hypothetical protein R2R35_03960 [Anaerocolumna sp. AGMB13020]